jgi:hypothetical protein
MTIMLAGQIWQCRRQDRWLLVIRSTDQYDNDRLDLNVQEMTNDYDDERDTEETPEYDPGDHTLYQVQYSKSLVGMDAQLDPTIGWGGTVTALTDREATHFYDRNTSSQPHVLLYCPSWDPACPAS